LVLLVAFGVTVFASDPDDNSNVEVRKSGCFPVHWCLPGTTAGDSAIETVRGEVEVREDRCFPVHWCLPGTTAGESAIDVAPISDTPQSAEPIDARAGAVSGKRSFRKRQSDLRRLRAGPMSAHSASTS